MAWFDELKSPKLKTIKKNSSNQTSPNDKVWQKCSACGEVLRTDALQEAFQVCPYCHHHFRLSAPERLRLLIDQGTFQEMGAWWQSKNPLQFVDKKDYVQRLQEAAAKSKMSESTIMGRGKIYGREVMIAIMGFEFMGGSMGAVTGEKITYAMEKAVEKKIPVVVCCCSGGARMQEGIISLMQMAKTSGMRRKLKENHIPYISVLSDPSTGGAAASFAMLGDINIAEPNALICFAGPRVIEQSIRQTLPEGFQRAEFLREHGFVDRIVDRAHLKDEIKFFLDVLSPSYEK